MREHRQDIQSSRQLVLKEDIYLVVISIPCKNKTLNNVKVQKGYNSVTCLCSVCIFYSAEEEKKRGQLSQKGGRKYIWKIEILEPSER